MTGTLGAICGCLGFTCLGGPANLCCCLPGIMGGCFGGLVGLYIEAMGIIGGLTDTCGVMLAEFPDIVGMCCGK
ncbi:MAG: hypothetical protein MASP_01026 [Candidatus Methanolliviera sp. GoM_asphalt]|nr:MAG: hypothetical protein MASP_01026 [Candidatus Methanolliviera sp. GoM_asphalt]